MSETGKTVAGGGKLTLYTGARGLRRDGFIVDYILPHSSPSHPWVGSGRTYTTAGHWLASGTPHRHDIVTIFEARIGDFS